MKCTDEEDETLAHFEQAVKMDEISSVQVQDKSSSQKEWNKMVIFYIVLLLWGPLLYRTPSHHRTVLLAEKTSSHLLTQT